MFAFRKSLLLHMTKQVICSRFKVYFMDILSSFNVTTLNVRAESRMSILSLILCFKWVYNFA